MSIIIIHIFLKKTLILFGCNKNSATFATLLWETTKHNSTRSKKIFNNKVGLVVQLVRISACHAEGREFESRPDREKPQIYLRLFLFTIMKYYVSYYIQNHYVLFRKDKLLILRKDWITWKLRWINKTMPERH